MHSTTRSPNSTTPSWRSQRQQQELTQLQEDAEAEVVRLREIESQRLQIEAVAVALAAQARDEARQLDELQRRQAEAARVAATSGVGAAVSAASSDGTTTGNLGASGGEAGGRTGGGGAGTNPRAGRCGYRRFRSSAPSRAALPTVTRGVRRAAVAVDTRVSTCSRPPAPRSRRWCPGIISHSTNVLGGTTMSLLGDNG